MVPADQQLARERIRSFLTWLALITVVLEVLVALASRWEGSWLFRALAILVTWSPAMAAWVAGRRTGRPLADIGFHRPTAGLMLIGYGIPIAYTFAVYGFVWGTGLGHFYDGARLDKMTVSLGLGHLTPLRAFVAVGLIYPSLIWLGGCAMSLGEEIGWRGFLLPELAKVMPFPRACVISGLAWAVWHYPLIIFGGYHGHTHLLYSMACFTLVIVAISFPLAWLRLKSGNVWTCTAFHASHNLFMLKLLNPLTQDTGCTRWLVSEFGIVTVVVTAVMAWGFWKSAQKH